MQLSRFFADLIDHGIVSVEVDREPDLAEVQELKRLLVEVDDGARLDLAGRRPGDLPALDLGAASWSAVAFHRAARFVVFGDRGLPPAILVGSRCPERLDPDCVYSVDLVMRFLPDLVKLARDRFGAGGSVRAALAYLARDWPLSSVGVAAIGPIAEERLAPVLAHASLRRLYVDRIVSRVDASRASHPVVQRELAVAAGAYRGLLPAELVEVVR